MIERAQQKQQRAALRAAYLLLLALVLGALLWDTAHTIPIDLNKFPDEQELEGDFVVEEERGNNNVIGNVRIDKDGDTQMVDAEEEEEEEGEQVGRKQERLATQKSGLMQNMKSLWSKLPKYFDFEQFKMKFKRTYKSSEDFIRKSIFLRNTLEVFKWRVSYRVGASKYLREVNKFSDRTPDEQRRLFMTSEPPLNELMKGQYVDQLRRRKVELELAQQQQGIETESQCARSGAGSGDETSCAKAQFLTNEQQASKLIERMFLDYQNDNVDAFSDALMEELREVGFESESQMAMSLDDNGDGDGERGTSAGNRPLGWPGSETQEQFWQRVAHTSNNQDTEMFEASIDWSRHECFHEIYDQGNDCGKCYVMAATALAEFYKCSEAGPGRKWTKRKFSKDYVLDCAQKFSPTLMGCAGGSPLDALRFLIHAGANNIRDWRAKKATALQKMRHQYGPTPLSSNVDPLDLKCPLNEDDVPMQEWGNQRLNLEPILVDLNLWQAALQDGPLIVWLQMPTEGFLDYKSGVHDGGDCSKSGAYHAMLLVGYGWDSNSGQTYWRFRNSFGPDWGDSGHFNLAQQVPSACLTGGVRVFRT